MKRTLNTAINRSKNEKNDEHYTQLSDIEDEVRHYRAQFVGKTVLCNCDDPRSSNFFKYFTRSFEILGLKRVIATCYKSQDVDLFTAKKCEKAVYQIYDGDANGNNEVDDEEIAVKELQGDGSFDSPECLRLLDEADIVVTNPPFSRFIDYLTLLVNRGKKFLILGNNLHATTKEIFPFFMENRVWLGYYYGNMNFTVPDHYRIEGNRAWVDENGQKWHSLGNIDTPDGLPLRTTYAGGRWIENVYDIQRQIVGTLSSDGANDSTIRRDAYGRVAGETNAVASAVCSRADVGMATNEAAVVGGIARTLRRTVDGQGRLASFGLDARRQVDVHLRRRGSADRRDGPVAHQRRDPRAQRLRLPPSPHREDRRATRRDAGSTARAAGDARKVGPRRAPRLRL